MPDKDILQLLDEYEGNTDTSNKLPEELPEEYSHPLLRPVLASPGRELEEYRVRVAAHEAGIDPDIAAGVALQESGFNPEATSRTGVKGTMQVTGRTAKSLGYDRNIPDQNIRAGIALIKKGLEANPNNIKRGLGIYPDPRDRKQWTNAVLSHSIKAKENRNNTMKTIDELISEVPEGIFDTPNLEQPVQNTVSNLQESSTNNDNTSEYIQSILPILMGGKVPELPTNLQNMAITGGLGSTGSPGGALSVGEQAVAQVMKQFPSLSKLVSKAEELPIVIQSLLGLGKSAAKGASYGAISEGINPEGTLESRIEAAEIGSLLPIALKPIAGAIKAIANKAGDITLGKLNVGKFINETFGPTKSIQELNNKNNILQQQTEDQLQARLSKYPKEIPVDINKIKPNRLFEIAQDMESIDTPIDKINPIIEVAGKLESQGTLTPSELNIAKRALNSEAYTFTNKPRASDYASNMRKSAHYAKELIEANTDKTVKTLNELHSKQTILREAINKQVKTNQKPVDKLLDVGKKAVISGGVGTAAGGPITGALTAGAGLAATTVPGFTTLNAAGKAIESPDLQRILSTLLPQWLKPEGD